MKTTLRLPTRDQYAFIEIEADLPTVEDSISAYYEAMKLLKPKEGIDEKTMNIFIDNMLLGNGKNSVEIYQEMSQAQKDMVQILKRGLKRITRNDEKED